MRRPSLIAYLRDKRILLILDTCEHLIEAVAALASRIFADAPQVHILATSREALQVEGEHVYRLDPLGCPPDDPALTAAAAQTFPATQLFVERAAASGARLDFSDAEAAIVASICRKLDGVPLAIELAARRVEAYGLQQTAALLDQRLTLLWHGPRTAPPRQKTLQATLDWSYGLLSDLERVVLRRLAVFVGHFTIDAALAVVTSATVDQALVFGAIDSLVAKSMVATRPIGAMMRYRLLDTTRAYALDDQAGRRRARRPGRRATRPTTGDGWSRPEPNGRPCRPGRNGRRTSRRSTMSARRWNGALVPTATSASASDLPPPRRRFSWRCRCCRNVIAGRSARSSRSTTPRAAAREEMHLQAALGVSLMFMHGNDEAARDRPGPKPRDRRSNVVTRSINCGCWARCTCSIGAPAISKPPCTTQGAASPLPEPSRIPAAIALAHSILGSSLHLCGDLAGARAELEAALQRGPGSSADQHDLSRLRRHYNLAGVVLARTLWLQGHPDQAVERARQSVEEAAAMDHSVTLSIALIWAISCSCGPAICDSAEAHTDWLLSHAESHSLAPYLCGRTRLQGELAIRRGDARGGVESLQGCLEELHAAPLRTAHHRASTSHSLEGLAAIGRLAEGHRADRRDDQAGRGERGPLLHAGVAAGEGQPSSLDAAARRRRRRSVLHAIARAEPSPGRARLGAAHRDRSGGAVGWHREDPRTPGRFCSRCSSSLRRGRIRRI